MEQAAGWRVASGSLKTFVTATLALATSASVAQGAPAPGVYGCYGQYGLSLPMMFGILDAKTYANYDGKTGRYSYSAGTLTMIDGPLGGIKYKSIDASERSFRMTDAQGNLTAFVCPKEGTKDAHKHPW